MVVMVLISSPSRRKASSVYSLLLVVLLVVVAAVHGRPSTEDELLDTRVATSGNSNRERRSASPASTPDILRQHLKQVSHSVLYLS